MADRSWTSSLIRAVVLMGILTAPALAGAAGGDERGDGGVVPGVAGRITGKVVGGGKPVAGVVVHAYPDATTAFRGDGAARSAPTGDDGAYVLDVGAGSWFLVARGRVPGVSGAGAPEAEYFGYYGGNPVQVHAGAPVTANVPVVRRRPPVVAADGSRDRMRLSGVVVGPTGPVEGASVFVYADASRQFRGPDLFGPQGAVSGGTEADGSFSVELPAGTYFLVATKRKGGATLGPLRPGDLYGYFDGNPLVVEPATRTSIVVQAGEKLRDAAPPVAGAVGTTGIRGRVRDAAGGTPAGVYAFATTDPSFMIGAMPPYRSQPVGPDGVYLVEVPTGGTYYVSARSGYGGPPLPGEWHGFFGEGSPRPVAVREGGITEGVDFVVRRME